MQACLRKTGAGVVVSLSILLSVPIQQALAEAGWGSQCGNPHFMCDKLTVVYRESSSSSSSVGTTRLSTNAGCPSAHRNQPLGNTFFDCTSSPRKQAWLVGNCLAAVSLFATCSSAYSVARAWHSTFPSPFLLISPPLSPPSRPPPPPWTYDSPILCHPIMWSDEQTT